MPAASGIAVGLATFRNRHDNRPQAVTMPWPKLAGLLTRHVERGSKDGPLWSPAVYRNGGPRANENVERITAAVGDFDNGTSLEEVKQRLAPYEYVLHTTHSHTWDKPKFRVVVPLASSVVASAWSDTRARIDQHVFGLGSDPATKDAARMFYLPSCPHGAPRFAEHHTGALLDPSSLPPATGTAVPTSAGETTTIWRTGDARLPLGKAALDFVANGAPLGEQRMRAVAAARNYLSASYTVEETAAALWRGLRASPQDPDRGPWTEADARQIAGDLANKNAPPIEDDQPLPPRCELRKLGLGYVATFSTMGVRLTIDHLRRGSDGLQGELLIEASIPLVSRQPFWGKFNLSSVSGRASLVKYLDKRANGAMVAWDDVLEETCRKIALAERAGTPFQLVGRLPPAEELGWMIANFAPMKEPMTVFGEGGSGKSMLMLAVALTIHTGKAFIPGFEPLTMGPVLYLDWEANPARIDKRVKLLCTGMGMSPEELPYRRMSGPLSDQIEEVLRYVQSEGTEFIVVDSAEMAMAGGKGEDKDANAPILRLHSAIRLLNTTVGLVDHMNKSDARSTKGRRDPYGGIYKTNLSRMVFELRRSAISIPGKMEMGLFNTKRNDDGPPVKPIGITLEFGDGYAKYNSTGITNPDLTEHLKAIDRISLVLTRGPMNAQEIENLTGLSTDNVRKTLDRWKDRRVIEITGRRWALLEKDEQPS